MLSTYSSMFMAPLWHHCGAISSLLGARATPSAGSSLFGETGGMPLIEVTYDEKLGEEVLRRLGALLPEVVSEAFDCPEEPATGPMQPGDIEIRFEERRLLLPPTRHGHPEHG